MIQKLGGRKVLITIGAVLIGLVTVFVKGDIPPNMLNLLEVVVGVFVAGNVSSKVAGAVSIRRGQVSTNNQDSVKLDYLVNSMGQTQQAVSAILHMAMGAQPGGSTGENRPG